MLIRQASLTSQSSHRQASPTEAPIAAAVLATLVAFAPAQRQFDELGAHALPGHSDLTGGVALGDIDADGDLDIVFGNYDGQNRLYLNDGTGTYADGTSQLPVDSDDTRAVALGDVDGDGDLDLVLGNIGFPSGQQNRLYFNDGVGNFTDVTVTRMPAASDDTLSVALGDVDGDSDLDIVFGNFEGRSRLYLNDGSGTYTDGSAQLIPVHSNVTAAVALGDVDGDSDLDLVFANSTFSEEQNRLYLNDGSGSYADATALLLPVDTDITLAVALGDVDGDGDLDMVFGNGVQQNRLYLNDGSGTYTDETSQLLPVDSDQTIAVALGDVDGDGDLDMVFGNGSISGGQNRLYLNDGSGNYNDVTALLLPADSEFTIPTALGDVDGDGDLDIVFGSLNCRSQGPCVGEQNRLYVNLLRQLDTPLLLLTPGGEYRLDAYARYGPPRPDDVAIAFVSTARSTTPLPPFGTIGIDLSRAAGPASIPIPQPSGMGSVSVIVPNNTSLIGVSVYAQALLVPSAGPWRLTNVTADEIVR